MTRETFGMTLFLFSVLLLVFSILGSYILGEIGVAITAFLYGVFGYFTYPFLALCIYTSLVMIIGKKFISGKWLLRIYSVIICAFLIMQLAMTGRFFGSGFGAYMDGCWRAAETSAAESTPGGLLFGLVVYPARAGLTLPGAYIVFSVLAVGALLFFLMGTPVRGLFTRRERELRQPSATHEREIDFENLPPRALRDEKPASSPRQEVQAERSEDRPAPKQNNPVAGFEERGQTVPPQYAPQETYQPRTTSPRYGQPQGIYQSQNYQSYGQRQNPQPQNPQPQTPQQQAGYPPKRELFRDGRIPPRRDSLQLTLNEMTERYGSKPKEQVPEQKWDGKSILFSPDPSGDYYRNIAYNGNYGRQRKSSVQPMEPSYSDIRKTEPTARDYPQRLESSQLPTYSEGFGREAEQPQQHVTRNIVEQRPESENAGYSFRTDELNYTRIPSFKAMPRTEEPSRDFNESKNSFSSERNGFDEPKVERFEDSRRELFDDTRSERFEEPRRELFNDARSERFEEPRRELFDDARSERFEEPRRELFDDPRNERFEEPRRELFDDPRNERFEEPRRELFDDARNERFEEPRRELFDDTRSERFEEPRRELFDDTRSERFEEPRRDFLDDARNERFEESRRDLFDEPEDESELPNLFPEREENELFEEPSRNELREESFGSEDRDAIDRGVVDFVASHMGFGGDDAGESRAIDGISHASSAELFDSDDSEDDYEPPRFEEAKPVKKKYVPRPYQRPSLSLLREYDDRITVSPEEVERNSNIIIDTLAGFRVDAEIIKVTSGPSVTRYDIDIPRNVSLGTVTKRSGEIAMRLHARDGVNMYANNEAGTISIEVPNSVRATVGISSVMQSEDYLREKEGSLMFAIGKDIEGRSICGNIAKMKHLLVAGATGSGKSVCLNTMLVSLICKYSPEELRLILIDPKKVEFTIYDGLPHMMINEIIADAQKAIMALNWSIKEMERRYELFEQKTRSGIVVRDLDEYNRSITEDEEKLPKIVMVVDELADLMMQQKKEIEERIQRLTQKSRAAGIHLVLATQRPSVNVITGVIKGNLPTRMAFRVIQEVDSRTILDESGAEKLLGNGDMLYKTEGMFNCARVQGAFLSSEEVQMIVNEIKQNNESNFDPEVSDYINRTEVVDGDAEDDSEGRGEIGGANMKDNDNDPVYIKSLAEVVKVGKASISFILRKLGVGYNRAGRIMEWMEAKGYVSHFDGQAKARTVLLTKEEFESRYGPLDSI